MRPKVNKLWITLFFATLMKILEKVLLVLGIVLIALNALLVLVMLPTTLKMMSSTADTAEKAGYVVGNFLLSFVGLVLLRISKRIDKKLKRKDAQEQVNEFLA